MVEPSTTFPQAIGSVIAEYAEAADDSPAVLLSGGIDSTLMLVALLEAGRTPVAYSFTLRDRQSSDFRRARKNAALLRVTFEGVLLPTDPCAIHERVVATIGDGFSGKANIECMWPLTYGIDAVAANGHTTLYSGLVADGLFGMSRKAHVKAAAEPDDPAWLDDFRHSYMTREKGPGEAARLLADVAAKRGVRMLTPYLDERIHAAFAGRSWRSLNKPRPKGVLHSISARTAGLDVNKKHQNLQLADSGIAETTGAAVLLPRHNPWGYRAPIGVYRRIAEGSAPCLT